MATAFSSLGYDLRNVLQQVTEYSEALFIEDKSLGLAELSAGWKDIHILAASTLRGLEPFLSQYGTTFPDADLLVVRQRLRQSSSEMGALMQPLQKMAEVAGRSWAELLYFRMEAAVRQFSGLVDEFMATKIGADSTGKLPSQAVSKTPNLFLVADDDDCNRDILLRFLKADDHLVLMAADGREALDLARKHSVDLFLLDLLMPNMSGLDTLRSSSATLN